LAARAAAFPAEASVLPNPALDGCSEDLLFARVQIRLASLPPIFSPRSLARLEPIDVRPAALQQFRFRRDPRRPDLTETPLASLPSLMSGRRLPLILALAELPNFTGGRTPDDPAAANVAHAHLPDHSVGTGPLYQGRFKSFAIHSWSGDAEGPFNVQAETRVATFGLAPYNP
jgi:hypothetical protein